MSFHYSQSKVQDLQNRLNISNQTQILKKGLTIGLITVALISTGLIAGATITTTSNKQIEQESYPAFPKNIKTFTAQ